MPKKQSIRYRSHQYNSDKEKIVRVSDYAKKVFLTEGAVREQCRLGYLRSFKTKGKWFVIVPKNFSLFLFSIITFPSLPELIAILALIIPLIIAFIALIQNLRIKDIELSAKIDLLVVKLDNYIQTKESDIKEFKEVLKELQDDIIKLKIKTGIIPDRRERDNED